VSIATLGTVTFRQPLLRKLIQRRARIGVFGLGTIGMQVALAFARAGFLCRGIDIDRKKVRHANLGRANDQDDRVRKVLASCIRRHKFYADSDTSLKEDFAILCLPTPLTETEDPDLSYLTEACRKLSAQDLSGKCVVLESSVYPGVTRNVLCPLLELGGQRAGKDFGLAHSPERIDLKNPAYPMERIPKIVGGINDASTDVAVALYKQILTARVVRVESLEIAEAAKMLENTYRFVNICLVNELSLLFESLHVDTYAVVRAASTKPFGFMPLYPGPGVGGHCIPKDPFYLLKVAKDVGKVLSIVEAAAIVNDRVPLAIASRLEDGLRLFGKDIKSARITVLGLAYKRNVSDVRRSPALPIITTLTARGTSVRAYDPLVFNAGTEMPWLEQTRTLSRAVRGADVILLMTDHDIFRRIDLSKIRGYLNEDPIVYDSRGFWDPAYVTRNGFFYMGLGRPSTHASHQIQPESKNVSQQP
jgi:nucleotide sugar dehydrogenase